MTAFEAVQHLSARARRVARLAWVGGAAAIVCVFVVVLGVQLVLAGRPSKGMGSVAAWTTIGAAVVILAAVRFGVKQYLRLRRPVWVEDLARQEGLDAKRLAESFTLDAW
ncbi:MAG: hypothetical protein JNJ54_06965 [Myxococcaceae bacterium]|nr:hypothetical protein [Myxococcaceae bacterium]